MEVGTMRRIIQLSDIDGIHGLATREARIARRHMPIPDGTKASLERATSTAAVFKGRVVQSDMGYDVLTKSLVLTVSGDAPCDGLAEGVYGMLPMSERPRIYRAVKRWGDPRQSDG